MSQASLIRDSWTHKRLAGVALPPAQFVAALCLLLCLL